MLVKTVDARLGLADTAVGCDDLKSYIKDGLEQTVWRGRCETISDGPRRWHLDGAHTMDSLKVAGRWFDQQIKTRIGLSVLICNQQTRPEAPDLLRNLQETLLQECGIRFDHVIFSTNVTRKQTGYRIEFENHNTRAAVVKEHTVQRTFAEVWVQADQDAQIHLTSNSAGGS